MGILGNKGSFGDNQATEVGRVVNEAMTNEYKSNLPGGMQLGQKPQAKLIVYTPRTMADTQNNPMGVRSDLGFTEKLSQAVNEQVGYNNQLDRKAVTQICRSVGNSEEILDAITVTPGALFQTSVFTNNYMFMLIIDNDVPDNAGTHSYRIPRNRAISHGYTTDDPVNMTNMGQGNTPNENCILHVTHKSTGMINAAGGNGGFQVHNDIDVLGDQMLINTAGNLPSGNIIDYESNGTTEYFVNTPSSMAKSVVMSESDAGTSPASILSSHDSINVKGTAKLKTSVGNPKKFGEVITKGLITGISNELNNNVTIAYGWQDDFANISKDEQLGYISGDMNLNDGVDTISMLGGSEEMTTLGELMARYDLKIVVLNNKNGSNAYNNIDPGGVDEVDIWSAMIAKAVPSIMIGVGITSAPFEYCTNIKCNTQTQSSYFDDPDELRAFHCELANVATITPANIEEKKHKMGAAYNLMLEYIFKPIEKKLGNVTVHVHYDTSTDIIVKLLLHDRNSIHNNDDKIHVEHCVLGGINSAMVANHDRLNENALNFADMIDNVLS